ncbi:MAG: hypothetical protein LRY41_03485 [Candidatus Pacebacteria bacterium]|nr:hypothetical protein [Candidatus Paceibacterota bacterium]MCD8508290.1 hypothetical protein [Candidatus Paceibacterota bacterium]MCD8528353.1 hypothetical protein [Candidatus Paceibacterota bacterium]MCD8563988.1 hypothetical protein [Candidatus Paceibacterota bacterium]
MKIYVGCALKHAPKEYKVAIANLKKDLAQLPHVEILEFVTTEAAPQEIYTNDIIDCVMTCDIMIAECSHPSLGLGYEIATMIEKRRKPVLIYAHADALVSGLILGAPQEYASCTRYVDISEIVEHVREYVQKHLHD